MAALLISSIDIYALRFHYTDPDKFNYYPASRARTLVRRSIILNCSNFSQVVEPYNHQKSHPSLPDQLKPLAETFLSERTNGQEALLQPSEKSKSIWVNPSSPRPSVLSLQPHKRCSQLEYSQIAELGMYINKLKELDVSEDDISVVFQGMPKPLTKENALCILHSLKSWEKSLAFFEWLKLTELFPMETIFYNVMMKSLRSGGQFELVEKLAMEMNSTGVELDNITYSTIITCAKKCGLYDKAIQWFESMYYSGVMPNEVTYCCMLDVYSESGMVVELRSLYERGRAVGWNPDQFALSVLAKGLGDARDFDGIKLLLQDIKSLGVKPNLVLYDELLRALGKVRKPVFARNFFNEMLDAGVTPNVRILTTMVKIYGKARWGRDAMRLWEQVKLNEWEIDIFLYNTLLNVYADVGFKDKAEELFEEMKASTKVMLDDYSYTAMLNLYGDGGDVTKAIAIFKEMLEHGVDPNQMGCTFLMQCLGRAKRFDDLVTVFDIAMDSGIKPDGRFYGCLLSVLTFCDDEKDAEKVLGCLGKCNSAIVSFIRLLEDQTQNSETIGREFRSVISAVMIDVRKGLCNCLIDVCHKKGLLQRASHLFYCGKFFRLYDGLYEKTDNCWCLNLQGLSAGAAYVVLDKWMKGLPALVEKKRALPEIFSVRTGVCAQGVRGTFEDFMKKHAAPFERSEEKARVFVADREQVISWVMSSLPHQMI